MGTNRNIFRKGYKAMRYRVYYKLKKWESEDEYRTKKFWPYPASISDRQIELPREVFNRIILGDNITSKDRDEIINCDEEFIGDIEIIDRKNAR